MGIRVEVTGVDKVILSLAGMVAQVTARTPVIINDVLARTERQQRTMLSLGWHPRGTKTGSAPGTPPWRISGDLSRSVTVDKAKAHGADKFEGAVGPTAIYARIQELGGVTGAGRRTHLPPRPSLQPAWEIVRLRFRDQFVAGWHVQPP